MTEVKTERMLLTVEEMAEQLGIGRTLAWRLVQQGDLPSVRLGRLVRVPVHALDEWLHDQTRDGLRDPHAH